MKLLVQLLLIGGLMGLPAPGCGSLENGPPERADDPSPGARPERATPMPVEPVPVPVPTPRPGNAPAAAWPLPPSSTPAPAVTSPDPGPALPTPDLFLQRLPAGGEYQDGRLFHTVRKGQSCAWLANHYLELTNHHTAASLKRAMMALNGLSRPAVSLGQRLEIPDVRTVPLKATAIPKAPDFEARGIFLTMDSAASDRLFTLLDAFVPEGLNTVVFDIKDMDGTIAYPSQVSLAAKTGATTRGPLRDLPKLINLLHARGIHVVARQVVFHDRITAQKMPELALQSKGGGPWREHGKQVWVDPARPEIQAYNIALAAEIAGLGVDEVQFDYIRFPAMGDIGSIEYSFDTSSTPKHQVITGFLKEAYEAVHARGVLLSLDVYGVVAWDKGIDVLTTGQRLEEMARYADIISPMVYPSHFFPPFGGYAHPAWEPYHFVHEGVVRTLRKVAAGGGTARVRPWLQAFRYMAGERFTPEYVSTQIDAARAAGGQGWLLWDANNRYEVGLQGVKRWNERLREQSGQASSLEASSR